MLLQFYSILLYYYLLLIESLGKIHDVISVHNIQSSWDSATTNYYTPRSSLLFSSH